GKNSWSSLFTSHTSVTTTAACPSEPPPRRLISRLRSYAIGRSSSSGRIPWPTTISTVVRRSKYRLMCLDAASTPDIHRAGESLRHVDDQQEGTGHGTSRETNRLRPFSHDVLAPSSRRGARTTCASVGRDRGTGLPRRNRRR